jgi:hypothetical protein
MSRAFWDIAPCSHAEVEWSAEARLHGAISQKTLIFSFTSTPKEGVQRISIALKNPSPRREPWVKWQAC